MPEQGQLQELSQGHQGKPAQLSKPTQIKTPAPAAWAPPANAKIFFCSQKRPLSASTDEQHKFEQL